RYSVILERELRPEVIWLVIAITIIGIWILPTFHRLVQTALVIAGNSYHDVTAVLAPVLRKPITHSNWCRAAWIAIAATWFLLVAAWLLFPTSRIELSQSLIRPESGYAYIAQISDAPFPFTLPADGGVAGNRSTLQMFENGIPLGPSHA